MPKKEDLQILDFRKKITNQFQLSQIKILSASWCITELEVCWRLITDGIAREKRNREKSEELSKK